MADRPRDTTRNSSSEDPSTTRERSTQRRPPQACPTPKKVPPDPSESDAVTTVPQRTVRRPIPTPPEPTIHSSVDVPKFTPTLRSEARPSGDSTLRSANERKDQALLESSSQERLVNLSLGLGEGWSVEDRYWEDRLLGKGGMGEVRLVWDQRVGRGVAMKLIRRRYSTEEDVRSRFLREARVQGQLEHPAIVPVYDLNRNDDGQLYFTMKRIKGRTLEEIIQGLRENDPEVRAAYSTRKLLSAMSSVCVAVAFAHSRGVIHRDLKPANIMLGDFGEVYVLDWGVAKVVAEKGETPETPVEPDSVGARRVGDTAVGILVGTPRYMSPEQAKALPNALDPRADTYSLGAILFEILALQPLHAGTTLESVLASTMTTTDPRPGARFPNLRIALELDEICARALALDPMDRFSSARELYEAIERYLDGERDAERRRELADRHCDSAQLVLLRVAEGGDEAENYRAQGMRELAAALALDPTHPRAMRSMLEALLEAPGKLPVKAEVELKAAKGHDRARGAKIRAITHVVWFVGTPLLLWMGVRSWGWFIAVHALVLLMATYAAWMARTGKTQPRFFYVGLAVNYLTAAVLGGVFGPLVMVPGIVAATAASFMVTARAGPITRHLILTLSLSAIVVPFALQWAGVLPPSYVFEDGAIKIVPIVAGFPPLPALSFLVVTTLLTVVLSHVLVSRGVDALVGAERRLFSQAWRLRQMLPEKTLDGGVDTARSI